MTYHKFNFYSSNIYYNNLKTLFKIIDKHDFTKDKDIQLSNHIFSIKSGDITSGIKWIWAGNKYSINYFFKFLTSINMFQKLQDLYSNNFTIMGSSFISIDSSEVNQSNFHLDMISQYDNSNTNIVTLIFPLHELADGIGHLEYKNNNDVEICKYDTNNVIIWDSCKFLHRTQPYKINKKEKRVLVSINLSTDEDWAVNITKKILKAQGSKYNN